MQVVGTATPYLILEQLQLKLLRKNKQQQKNPLTPLLQAITSCGK